MSEDERPSKPNPDEPSEPGRLARVRQHRFTWPIVAVAIFVAAAALSVLGVVTVRGVSAASAAIAVAVIAVGLLLWLPSGENKGSRGELGAAVLGGAVVAFALLFFEGQRETAADRLANEQAHQLIVANQLATQADLRGFQLHAVDLSGLVLANKRLDEADLSQASLRGTNLKGSSLQGSDLIGADLIGASLAGSDLRGALYSTRTVWPPRFDYSSSGAIMVRPGLNLRARLLRGFPPRRCRSQERKPESR
jgi:hypothetical protein